MAINQSVVSTSFSNGLSNGFYTSASTSLALDSSGLIVLNINITA